MSFVIAGIVGLAAIGRLGALGILLMGYKSIQKTLLHARRGMEFASLEDAYGEIPKNKKGRRRAEGFQAYDLPPTDPDRPAVKRMLEVPPVNQPQPNDPENMNDFMDQSTQFQQRATVNNSLPNPRTIERKASAPTSFFGAEPFTNPSEDSMAPFSGRSTNPNSYMLESDFTKSFDQPGYGKSSGVPVPTPELRQRWKPLSVDRVDTAFTSGKERSSQFTGLDTSDFTAMKLKLDTLMARLDDLEFRAGGTNPQMEMLSFIMTGLFLMFILDVAVRKVSRV